MVPVPLLWQHVAKETASAKKKMHHIAKKAHFQMCPSCMFCSRNNLKTLSSDDEGQTPTAACMHHVFTEAQHGGTQCGCGKGESKAENKGYILTAARSHLPTCSADKKHASSVNNYMLCESTAISDNPRQSTAPSDIL